MYAVIFIAEINDVDETYSQMAAQLRERARKVYGCTDFISVTEDGKEISISYWESEDQIRRWKQDSEHMVAQRLGRSTWYRSYKIQVVEVVREYGG